jgi:enoyl-CoA hydratase/carnithine racemase
MTASEFSDALLCRNEGGVARLTLNRPEAINAFNMELRRSLPAALKALDADPAVRVIVIDGAGERGFSAGADIRESRGEISTLGEKDRLSPHGWIEAVSAVKKPVIAVLHGVCMGAGLELALACDLRIAARGARFALPEMRIGLMPGGGGTQRLSRVIGLSAAMDMTLTGEEVSGERAYELGLVSRLLDSKDAALAEALRLAGIMTERCGHALAYAKEAVTESMEGSLASGLRLETSLFAILAGSLRERLGKQ